MPNSAFILTTNFKPLSGGVAEYLHNLWDQVARVHPVTVVSTVAPGSAQWKRAYQLEVLALPEGRSGSRVGDGISPIRKLNTLRYFLALHRGAHRTVAAIRERAGVRPQIFVGGWNVGSHAWCRELRRAGLSYSLFAYGTEIIQPLAWPFSSWRRDAITNAREVLVISEGTAELVRSRFGEGIRIQLVRPGVLPCIESAGSTKADHLLPEMGIPEGDVLLTVARLVPRKGIDLVLRSVAELAAEHPALRYVVAGEGPDGDRLRGLVHELGIESRVRFMGHVDEATKWALYRGCDIFVLPNRLMSGTDWEGFGIVFLEAALTGTPAIGGRNGGVPDAIDHAVTGLLVDPEDPASLTLSLRKLLQDKELRQRMGQAAKQRAECDFNWGHIAAQFRTQQGWRDRAASG